VESCCSLQWIVFFAITFVFCLDPVVGTGCALCEICMLPFPLLWDG